MQAISAALSGAVHGIINWGIGDGRGAVTGTSLLAATGVAAVMLQKAVQPSVLAVGKLADNKMVILASVGLMGGLGLCYQSVRVSGQHAQTRRLTAEVQALQRELEEEREAVDEQARQALRVRFEATQERLALSKAMERGRYWQMVGITVVTVTTLGCVLLVCKWDGDAAAARDKWHHELNVAMAKLQDSRGNDVVISDLKHVITQAAASSNASANLESWCVVHNDTPTPMHVVGKNPMGKLAGQVNPSFDEVVQPGRIKFVSAGKASYLLAQGVHVTVSEGGKAIYEQKVKHGKYLSINNERATGK